MRIQVITMREQAFAGIGGVDTSPFRSPRALGAYDFAVIDFQYESFWRNPANSIRGVNSQADLETLEDMICGSTSCRVLILLPKNHMYQYNLGYHGQVGKTYGASTPLKDVINKISEYTLAYVLPDPPELAFGRSVTPIGPLRLDSDFHVAPSCEHAVIPVARSEAGGITAFVSQDRFMATTMDVSDGEVLLNVIELFRSTGQNLSDLPEWLDKVPFLDESNLRERLEAIGDEISDLQAQAMQIEGKLAEYAEKKSVLCLKDDELETIARSMLAEILDIQDEFIDEKEEDFLYESDSVDICFEIKGSVGGLKRQHVSKAFDHAQIHADELEGKNVSKATKAILVFSSEIGKSLEDRGPYPKGQITIAQKTGVGVMSSETLLRCYEAKLHGELDAAGFVAMLVDASGLISFECARNSLFTVSTCSD